MATSLGMNARLTLATTRLFYIDRNQRLFSTCQVCFASRWHVFDKASRLREVYKAPIDAEKYIGKGDVKHINIPDKIERNPTAILEALASTVKNHINQPMYKGIDDPHLYLTSDRQKKQMLASKDSGIKTAQMMLSMYPDYFMQIWMEPLPDSWRDANLGYKFKDPSEEALLERIAKLAVQDAISVYKDLMAKKNIPNQETQEKLLELLTVYNCNNPENISDLSYYVDAPALSKNAPFPVSTWKKGNIAEQVFNSLPNKTSKAYCHMIRGMTTNYDKEGAMEVFNEMKAANLSADVYTYNMLLTVASLNTESIEDVKQFVEVLLRDMATSNVNPNVETFNNVLSNCRRLSRWTGAKKFALSVLSEMKACGIEPTLATYEEILKIFYYYKDKSPKTPALFEKILDEIDGKEFKCSNEHDVLFFRTAMRVISTHFPDSKYAIRLHNVLQTGKNADLLGHRQLVFAYYFDLFMVITPLEHIDYVMKLYTSVVPFIFTPSSEVYYVILDSIQIYDAYHYLPQLYTDIQYSTMFHDENFTETFAKVMAKQKHDPELQGHLCNLATSLIKNWLQAKERLLHNKPYMDGSVIGHFIIVFLNNDQTEEAWELFQFYLNNIDLRYTHPSETSLTRLAEQLIVEKNYPSVKEVLDRMQSIGYTGLSSLVENILQTFQLPDQERNYLQCLAADSVSSSSSSSSESSSDSD